jgi:hypothetical protein
MRFPHGGRLRIVRAICHGSALRPVYFVVIAPDGVEDVPEPGSIRSAEVQLTPGAAFIQ